MSVAKNQLDGIDLRDRDLSLLRGLFECRVMTPLHAAALYFDGKPEAAKKRLQKLKAAGLIGDRPRRAFEPSVLFLAKKGLSLLREKGVLAEYPEFDLPALDRRARVSALTIRHELEVMDVKVAFHSGIKALSAFSITEFSTWPLLNEFRACHSASHGQDVLVKPDGFIRILEKIDEKEGFEHSFFLEVDRSSEVQDILIARAGCYLNYYKSGGFAVRNGAPRSQFKGFPFRVLMVFKTAERRNNTAERLLQNNPPILTQVSLSTITEVTQNPLGEIWVRPLDYRNAVAGTSFEVHPARKQYEYQRQTARELFVEGKVRKTKILTDDSGV
jgi:hypothetical protein